MKSIIISIQIFLLFSCINENENPLIDHNDSSVNEKMETDTLQQNVTVVEFDNLVFDFGKVKNDTMIHAKYYYKNTGENVLEIEFVNPDCGCTDYVISSNSLLPGESGYIELQLDTKEKFGIQKIYAIVKLNSEQRFHKLLLTGEVINKQS